jgi:4-hydroxy-4-methyl-2-oxoglutarate aldolase
MANHKRIAEISRVRGAHGGLLRLSVLLLLSAGAYGQLGLFSPQQRIELTREWKGERFEDGRPKVPDAILARMKDVSAEEAWAVLNKAGYRDHFESGWMRFNATNKRLVGRVVTAVFMPVRPDLNAVINEHGKAEGRVSTGQNSWVIDTLQPGDVLVVDLFGKYNFMGDNLATAVFAKSKNGIVVDGGIRDLTGAQRIEGFQGFVRYFHPSSITRGVRNVMLMGINVPIRIGETTVVPGDVVLGDPEGLMFIPAHLAQRVADNAEQAHLRDEWGQMLIREGKYTPGQIDTGWTKQMQEEFGQWVEKHKTSGLKKK